MGITLDDDLLRDFFGNGEQRSIFDARARLQGWLDTERALAETQAELGLIPIAAAERIAAACEATEFDLVCDTQVALAGRSDTKIADQ